MADETKVAGGGDSVKTVQALALVLIVILGVFMVTSVNKVKAELVRMNQQVDALVSTAAQNSIGGFQAVNEDGTVNFRFAPIPMTEGPECGMGGPACPTDAPRK